MSEIANTFSGNILGIYVTLLDYRNSKYSKFMDHSFRLVTKDEDFSQLKLISKKGEMVGDLLFIDFNSEEEFNILLLMMEQDEQNYYY